MTISLPGIDEAQESRLARIRIYLDLGSYPDLVDVGRLTKANEACMAILVRAVRRATISTNEVSDGT